MSTFAALIGATSVPATFQVTVWLVPFVVEMAVFGEVTRNGPVPGARLTVVSALFTPPPPEAPSRAVRRKCIGPAYTEVGRNSE